MRRIKLFCLIFLLLCGARDAAANDIFVEKHELKTDALLRPWPLHVLRVSGSDNHPYLGVIYLLHGSDSFGEEWITQGGLLETLKSLSPRRKLPKVIIVLPTSENCWYVDSRDIGGPGNYETAFLKDLVPYIESRYGLPGRAGARAVSGISMGGWGALRLALAHPDVFGAAASQGGSFWLRRNHSDAPTDFIERTFSGSFGRPLNRQMFDSLAPSFYVKHSSERELPSIMMTSGYHDYIRSAEMFDLAAEMMMRKIMVRAEVTNGGHDWDSWRESLPSVLEFLFDYLERLK